MTLCPRMKKAKDSSRPECGLPSPNDPEREYVGEGATIGRVLLGRSQWRLDAMGAVRLEKLRERFEKLMGNLVRFAGEHREDLRASLGLDKSAWDTSLVPPALLANPPRLMTAMARVPVPEGAVSGESITKDFEHQRDREFLDQGLPALKDKTPREAASDPALRPQLIELIKSRIYSCDLHNLETGGVEDIDWMVRELGLNEILFDPPPRRSMPKQSPVVTPDEEEEPAFLDLPPPPPLPSQPWTDQEARELFGNALAASSTLADAVDYLKEMDYPLLDDLREVVGDMIEEDEHRILAGVVALLVASFAPRGTSPPNIWPDDLQKGFKRAISTLTAVPAERLPQEFMDWLKGCRQPQLVLTAVGLLQEIKRVAPAGPSVQSAHAITMYVVLRVVTDELDRAMQRNN